MPAYNAEDTIDDAIDSVAGQLYSRWSLWVVDDGSRDDTVARVQARSETDSRIHLIEQPNAGPAAARNRALEQCHGDTIAFLDADDLWEPRHLEHLVGELGRQPDVGLAWCEMACFGDASGSYRGEREPVVGSGAATIPRIFQAVTFLPSAVVCRREFFERGLRFPSQFKVQEDVHVWCAIAREARIAHVDEVLTRYRMHQGSLSTSRYAILRHLDVIVDSYRQLYHDFREYIPRRLYRERVWGIYNHAAEDLMRLGQRPTGELLRALSYRPLAARTWKNLVKVGVAG